jgi:hypothetical protein
MLGRMLERKNWHIVLVILYATGYLLFPPRVLVINDEERYVAQALAFAHGELNLPGATPLLPAVPQRTASDYPPGTSLLQAVAVRVVDWRAAGFISVLGMLGLALFTAKLLRALALPVEFALATLAFPGTLFFGRVAMSDVPTAAMVSLTLWLTVSCDGKPLRSIAAGVAAAGTLLFREPTALLIVPFVAGAIVRRRCVPAGLLLGGAFGVGIRLLVSAAMFGDAFHVRNSGYGFSIAAAIANFPLYVVVLLALFPMAALLPFLYRGPRRAEMIVAFGGYALLFLFYDYRPWQENGIAKGTLLASRFFIPALPLLAVMAGHVLTRVRHPLLERLRAAVPAAYVAVAVAMIVVHPLFRRLEAQPFGIVRELQRRTTAKTPIVINEKAIGKYLSPVYSERQLIWRDFATRELLLPICLKHGGLQIAFLDRSDSELFRADAEANDRFLLGPGRDVRATLSADQIIGDGIRLRVLETGCSASPAR